MEKVVKLRIKGPGGGRKGIHISSAQKPDVGFIKLRSTVGFLASNIYGKLQDGERHEIG